MRLIDLKLYRIIRGNLSAKMNEAHSHLNLQVKI